ncbi:MAG: hypothetical protein Q4A75_05635 [Peptostreptococcaceae bacterium]|nr:hypothetical protein [Peptostreptococcaceae bacterium]
MILHIGDNILDIDVERTRSYYREHGDRDDCTCSGCKNYRLFAQNEGKGLHDVFDRFGLRMRDVVESTALESEKIDAVSYHCLYHVCGRIIQKAKEHHRLGMMEVRFLEELDMMEEDLPQPAFQMELWIDIPWLLEEKNDYYKPEL